jgi:hypothetical protein
VKIKLNPEIAMVAGLLLLTVIYLVETIQMPPPMEDGSPTISLYPWIVILVMTAACVSVLSNRKITADKAIVLDVQSVQRPFIGIAVIGLFVFLFAYSGYWIATAFFSFCMAVLFEYEKGNLKRALWYAVLLAAVIPVVGYLFYHGLFDIRLPKGVWS